MSVYKVFHKQETQPGSLLDFWKCSLYSKVDKAESHCNINCRLQNGRIFLCNYDFLNLKKYDLHELLCFYGKLLHNNEIK